MNSWWRLIAVAAASAATIYVGSILTTSQSALLIGLLLNILAAPFGQRVTNWVELGWERTRPVPTPAHASTPLGAQPNGREAGTALVILATNTYALLLVNLASASLLAGLDKLETAKMLSFTALGYAEAQKYLAGCLFSVVWIPATTAVSLVLAASTRPIPLRAFLFGTGLSLPLYFFLSRASGLASGQGDLIEPSFSLGGSLPPTPGYSGFQVTALLYQTAMLTTLGIALTLYAWIVARTSRLALSGLTRHPSRFERKSPRYPT